MIFIKIHKQIKNIIIIDPWEDWWNVYEEYNRNVYWTILSKR